MVVHPAAGHMSGTIVNAIGTCTLPVSSWKLPWTIAIYFLVIECSFNCSAILWCALSFLQAGRTHQIRVHMAWIHHPLLGDDVYGRISDQKYHLMGQVLHAGVLGFIHPSAIFGFHLLVWCPKWTPASNNCFIEITLIF